MFLFFSHKLLLFFQLLLRFNWLSRREHSCSCLAVIFFHLFLVFFFIVLNWDFFKLKFSNDMPLNLNAPPCLFKFWIVACLFVLFLIIDCLFKYFCYSVLSISLLPTFFWSQIKRSEKSKKRKGESDRDLTGQDLIKNINNIY